MHHDCGVAVSHALDLAPVLLQFMSSKGLGDVQVKGPLFNFLNSRVEATRNYGFPSWQPVKGKANGEIS